MLRPGIGESCAVLGGGTVGLSAVMAAAVVGCDPIIVVEPQADRRALGLELGATLALDREEGDSDPKQFIAYLIDLYRAGRFPVDRLVRFYAFADINRAIADQHAGRVIKPV